MNSKNIGRLSFFKHIGLTILIISGILLLSIIIFPELKRIIHQNVINTYLNKTSFFSIQIIIDIIITYFISGKVGESIIEKNRNPFKSVFKGFLNIWLCIFIVAMFSEIIPRLIEYGINIWSIMIMFTLCITLKGPLFLIIGVIQAVLTSSFIGKEIEKRKKTLQQHI